MRKCNKCLSIVRKVICDVCDSDDTVEIVPEPVKVEKPVAEKPKKDKKKK